MIDYIVQKEDWLRDGIPLMDFLWAIRNAKIIREAGVSHRHKATPISQNELDYVIISICCKIPLTNLS